MKQTKLMVMAMMAVALMATSCASKKDLQNCQNENKELSSNYQATKEKLAATEASLAAAQEQLATAKSDSLNMVLTNNLTRSLSKEEMKEVDVQVLKGVVYISLADNMLYQSGSYEVNSRAQETLSKIAKIITDYKDYDVLVEGTTDNVPVSTTSAKMKNIRNNWDLSALRAASVVQYLQDHFGVNPKRLTAGGRGEYNPVTTNDTEVGKQRNRRTQIIITPKLDQFMDLIDKAPESDK